MKRIGSQLLVINGSWKYLLIRAAIALVIVLVGGGIVRSLGNFEMPLAEHLNSLHHGFVGTVGNLLYQGFEPTHAIILAVVLTVVLLIISRDLRVAAVFALTTALTWLPVAVIKNVVGRARPDVSLLPFPYHPVQLDASYPSGHATFITVLVLLLIALFVSKRASLVAGIVGGVIIALAGLLLTIDAVHYVTDVLASIVWVIGFAPLVRAVLVRIILPRMPFLAPRDKTPARY